MGIVRGVGGSAAIGAAGAAGAGAAGEDVGALLADVEHATNSSARDRIADPTHERRIRFGCDTQLQRTLDESVKS
jgi:hypothetical protein